MATDSRRSRPRRQLLAVAGALCVISVVSTWVASGPHRRGPVHRGGVTRVRSGASHSLRAATVPDTSTSDLASTAWPPWEAELTGALHQRAPDPSGVVAITIDGRLSGSRQGSMTIVLLGLAAGGRMALQHSAVELDLNGGGHLSGDVVALSGDTLVAAVSDGGVHLELGVFLRVDPSTGAVAGPVTAEPAPPGSGP